MKVFKDAPTKIELIKAAKLLENQCECSPLVHAKIAECIKALNDEKWKQAITLAKQVGAGGKVGAAKSIAMTRTLARGLSERIKKYAQEHVSVNISEEEKRAGKLMEEYFAKALSAYKAALEYYKNVWEESKRVVEAATKLQTYIPVIDELSAKFSHVIESTLQEYREKQNIGSDPFIKMKWSSSDWKIIDNIFERLIWTINYLKKGYGYKAVDQLGKIDQLLDKEKSNHPEEYQILNMDQTRRKLSEVASKISQSYVPGKHNNDDYYEQYRNLKNQTIDLQTVEDGAHLCGPFEQEYPSNIREALRTYPLFREVKKLAGRTFWKSHFTPWKNSLKTFTCT